MKNKIVDIVCLCLVGAVFGGTALWNLVQPNRPTVSETEKRKLAAMPELTVSSLTDGSYFAGVSAFISDTFVARDRLVGLSRRMDTLKGFDYALDGADNFVVLNPSGEQKSGDNTGTTPEDEEHAAAIDAVFDALFNGGNTASGQDERENDGPENVPTDDQNDDQNDSQNDEASNGQNDVEITPPGPDTAEGEDRAETEAPETDPAPDAAETTAPEPPAETEASAGAVPDPGDVLAGLDRGDGEDAADSAGSEPEDGGETYRALSLKLSKQKLNLTVGTGTVLYAYAESTDPNGAVVHWANSDKNVATISINPNGGIDVKAVGPGTAKLTCTIDNFKAECEVKVSELTLGVDFTPPDNDENLNADFLPDGLFIYGDAVYTQAFYSPVNANWYAKTAAYYAKLFGCRVSTVVAPVSSMVIDNPNVKAKVSDQGDILQKMRDLCDASVNFVDTYTPLYEHRDEYLFFRTDHHWTQRGAYYAYTAFAESVGLTPTPLSFFEFKVHQEEYHGSMDLYTNDTRVQSFKDSVEAFYPTKQNTMTLTDKNGKTWQYSSCINNNSGYLCFIGGDHPYTVINVPDNPQDKNILVLKDSFGNAFVPYLCEHYGNIIVVDVRWTNMNVYEQLKDYGLTDIVFINNIQAANSYAWSKMYMAAVGEKLP